MRNKSKYTVSVTTDYSGECMTFSSALSTAASRQQDQKNPGSLLPYFHKNVENYLFEIWPLAFIIIIIFSKLFVFYQCFAVALTHTHAHAHAEATSAHTDERKKVKFIQ